LKTILKILLGIMVILLVAAGGFVLWAVNPAQADSQAQQAALQAQLLSDGTLYFVPDEPAKSTGIIFYPGGRVDYRAYSPLALALAKSGYPVYLLKAPLNLAVFNPNAAAAVVDEHPEIDRWLIGGHSLGGSMAASYLDGNPQVPADLFILASYPAESNDLSGRVDLRVLSISASNDGLATPEKIDASRALLPVDAVFTVIEGGNHAYFGYYGEQAGDGQALISRDDQQAQVLQAFLDFLSK